MKSLLYALGFGIIGLVIGAIAGIGETRYYKKSQRATVLPIAVILCGGAFAVIGAGIGYATGEDERKRRSIGLDAATTEFFKQGRFWVAVTRWRHPDTGAESSIKTGKNQHGELQSNFNHNGQLHVITHGVYSGSQVNVQKAHNVAINNYYKFLKESLG